MESTRLPRKMLLRETGKTLIQHTYEAAHGSAKALPVFVATDSEKILDEVFSFGGYGWMTNPNAFSGTDRIAEVARRGNFAGFDIIVNLQGDEPEISGEAIDLAIELLEKNPEAVMSTLATPIWDRKQLDDPACVKVVFDDRGRALYFGRSLLPCLGQWELDNADLQLPNFYQHIGLYAFRRDFLLRFAARKLDAYERQEKLEQTRALRMGEPILVGVIDEPTFGIDTPEDYRTFVERFNESQILDGN